jgi:hypothetical protein
MDRRVLLLGCVLLLAALAASQTSTPEIAVGSVFIARPGGGIVAVTGAPYSAEETYEMKQTLADGTHIDRTMPVVKIYRDSMGRTRTERSLAHGGSATQTGSAQGPIMVEINDPVAHKRYIFNSEERIAHRQKLPSGPARPSFSAVARPAISSPPAPFPSQVGRTTTTEELGTQIMEGISVQGRRTTTTWPVGSMGNDRPITTISETWFSPELRMMILSKVADPRSGEHTHRVVKISRGDPDPSLFGPPAGYVVKDEKH